MFLDKTWPWKKNKLNTLALNKFEKARQEDGVLYGLGVLADGTLQSGAFVINGCYWIEDVDVANAFDFSSLLNRPVQVTEELYARYRYTATDPHANVVYGHAISVPSKSIRLGVITVPPNSAFVTQEMISTADTDKELSSRYRSDYAVLNSDTRIPTQDQKDALAGTGVPPSDANRFTTQADLVDVVGDNLGNHTSTQDVDFAGFKGVNCGSPVLAGDVANMQFVLDNIGGQNLVSSVSQLRKHMIEMQLMIEGFTNSPYPDNCGQPFFRTEFEDYGGYFNIDGRQVFQSDHDLSKLTADVITDKRTERGRVDTRLQLPRQYYFGEAIRHVQIPDIANKPHAITYCPDEHCIYMITRGDGVDDTVLHRINMVSLQVENSWFFDEGSFTRWNGIATGIAYGNKQLYLIEYGADNSGVVCIRFDVGSLPLQETKITKSNVKAIESAKTLFNNDYAATEVFNDIAYDVGSNYIWALRYRDANNHELVRFNASFVENGNLAYDTNTIDTSQVDTAINGIDFDGNFLWFTGDTWSGRMSIDGVVSAKWKRYGGSGICYINDDNLPSIDGQIFNTDKIDLRMWAIAIRNTYSLPASATYRPVHAVANIGSVDNTTKEVTLVRLDGGSPAFVVNEFRGFHVRVGSVCWLIANNTNDKVTLDTQLDISGLSGVVELGAVRKNFTTTLTTSGMKVWSYEGGIDNVSEASTGFMLDKDTEVGSVGIELGTVSVQGNIEIRIETDNDGVPSGVLPNVNATTVIASGSLMPDSWNVKAFADVFALSKDTIYHVVIANSATCQIKGHIDGFNDYGMQVDVVNVKIFSSAKLAASEVSDVAAFNNLLYVGYKQAVGATEYKPDGTTGIDSYIDEASATVNFGTGTQMRVACNEGVIPLDTWFASNMPITSRSYHTSVLYGGKMYVFGGYNGTEHLNDLWECDLTTFVWMQKTSGATARRAHAAVVYNGKMYIFGGFNGSSYYGDLWECDLTTFTWTQRASSSISRYNPSAVLNGSKMYVFGGNEGSSYFNDLWECDLTTFTWTQKASGATDRYAHSAVVYNGKMYLFGGRDTSSTYLNDLWECDLTTFVWTQRASGATARRSVGSVVYNGKMYIFGGSDGASRFSDLWECDLTTFTWTQRVGGATSRDNHTAVLSDGKMCVFGGNSGAYLSDLWECNLTTFTWTQKALAPSVRYESSSVLYGSKMYMFGGYGDSSHRDDLWECDLTTFVWTQRASGATARRGHSAVVYNGKMYVFGGFSGSSYLNDLWECDLATFAWTQRSSGATARYCHSVVLYGSRMYVFGGGSSSSSFNDLWECDLTTFTWTQKASGATVRNSHVAVLDGSKMYVFGGINNTSLNDLWECDLTTFVWTQRASGATVRYNSSAVLSDGKMYVFGGSDSTSFNDLWECDLTTFVWTQKTGGSTIRRGHSAVIYDGRMHVFGGRSNTVYYNDLWRYNIVSIGGPISIQRGVVKFDLSNMPSNIVSVALSLYLDVANAASKTVQLHKINEDFTEQQVTWNEKSSGSNWTTAGGQFDASPVVERTVTNSPGYVSFDITSLYNQWKSEGDNYGVIVRLSDETTAGNYVYFATSDSVDIDKRPKLTINTYPTYNNAGVLTRDKIVGVGYGGTVTQALNISDRYLFVGLDDRVHIMDVCDNTVLQVLNNVSYPGITGTAINDIDAKKLVADEYTYKTHQYLVVACNNGVSIINMTTGTSFPIYNYEIESNSAVCKKVSITDDGKLVIVTETATPGVFQVDIFGDITKIYTSNTNKSWELQTGLRKTLKGPSGGGVLPSDMVKAVDTRTLADDLLGYGTNLILIANGSNLCEYDVIKGKLEIIDTVSGMVCCDVVYSRDTIGAIFTDSSTDGMYRQYDAHHKGLNYVVGKSSSCYSRLNFESWDLLGLRVLEGRNVAIITASGVELFDIAFKDTNSFSKAVWQSTALYDANGIARATAMIRGFRLPRELVVFSEDMAVSASSISVNHGSLGSLISKGDTLYLYSTSETSVGNGEKVLVASSYDESSGVIPLESTTLAENIGESSTVIKLASKSVVDALPVQGVVKIGNEQMLYNGKSGQNILVTARGINGTTPADHIIGDTVNTVLRFDYLAGDEVVFMVNKKRIDKLVDLRVMESNDGVTYTEGSQVMINDVDAGYYNEAVRSDLPYGQIKLSLSRTDYVGDSVGVDNVSVYWENY